MQCIHEWVPGSPSVAHSTAQPCLIIQFLLHSLISSGESELGNQKFLKWQRWYRNILNLFVLQSHKLQSLPFKSKAIYSGGLEAWIFHVGVEILESITCIKLLYCLTAILNKNIGNVYITAFLCFWLCWIFLASWGQVTWGHGGSWDLVWWPGIWAPCIGSAMS